MVYCTVYNQATGIRRGYRKPAIICGFRDGREIAKACRRETQNCSREAKEVDSNFKHIKVRNFSVLANRELKQGQRFRFYSTVLQ